MHEQPAREFDGFRIVGRSERRAMASRSTRVSSKTVVSDSTADATTRLGTRKRRGVG
jgi:hypothetical protein